MAFLISDEVLDLCTKGYHIRPVVVSGRGFMPDPRSRAARMSPRVDAVILVSTRFRARSILGLDIQTATGAMLDALCGIPTRPAGMTDAQMRAVWKAVNDAPVCDPVPNVPAGSDDIVST